MVARTRLNVTLYVHCLPCINPLQYVHCCLKLLENYIHEVFGGVAQIHFPFLSSYSCSKCCLNLLETVGHRVTNRNMRDFTVFSVVSLEAIAATEFYKIFSGKQPRQDVTIFRPFGCAAHPVDGERVSYRNVGNPSHLNAAVCPRKFYLFHVACKFLNGQFK